MILPRRFLVFSIVLVVPLIVAGTLYSSYEGSRPEVTTLAVMGAPDNIVFVSDLHVRDENLAQVRELVRQINGLHPSVVLIAGDFMVGDEGNLSLQEVWADLDAPAYAVLGNHDYHAGIGGGQAGGRIAWVLEILLRARGMDTSSYYVNGDKRAGDELERQLESEGITVLRNEAVEISHDGKLAIIAGVDDIWAGQAGPVPVTRGDLPVIYLVHEPVVYPEWHADLVLSGHTHGGQFNNQLFLFLDSFGIADIKGLHRKGDTLLYITRGTGTSASGTDRRFLSPPEIVLINPSP